MKTYKITIQEDDGQELERKYGDLRDSSPDQLGDILSDMVDSLEGSKDISVFDKRPDQLVDDEIEQEKLDTSK